MTDEIWGLSQEHARRIIDYVGGSGIPPEYGFQFYTVGLDDYLHAIEEEYFKNFIKYGGAAFKMVVAGYGCGKTHFLYCIRERAWKNGYITSYVSLSPTETPFYSLEKVYRAIVQNLMAPLSPEELLSKYEKGIEALIMRWYMEKYQEIAEKLGGDEKEIIEELERYVDTLERYESSSFRNAVKEAFLSVALNKKENNLVFQWLKGEDVPKRELSKFGIFEKIDKSTAFKMIRSLNQWLNDIGYHGLVVLFDEAERTPSMSSKQKTLLLNNLRELIDACGRDLKNIMFFFATPDESFLKGRTGAYVALEQRVSTVFDPKKNPFGVKITIEERTSESTLIEIGKKLGRIYEIAMNVKMDPAEVENTAKRIASELEMYPKREFVKKIVSEFGNLSAYKREATIE